MELAKAISYFFSSADSRAIRYVEKDLATVLEAVKAAIKSDRPVRTNGDWSDQMCVLSGIAHSFFSS